MPDATTVDWPPSIFRIRPLGPNLAVGNGGTQGLVSSPPDPASATYSLPSGPKVNPRGASSPPMTTVRAPWASVVPARLNPRASTVARTSTRPILAIFPPTTLPDSWNERTSADTTLGGRRRHYGAPDRLCQACWKDLIGMIWPEA